jgi:hypothetical protein
LHCSGHVEALSEDPKETSQGKLFAVDWRDGVSLVLDLDRRVANFGFLPNAIILSRTCPWDQRSSLPVHDIVPRIGDTATVFISDCPDVR